MNIRQAARWAERQDALVKLGRDGQPDYLCAVYDVGTHLVECIGSHEKCDADMRSKGCAYSLTGCGVIASDGRYLCLETLDTVCQELDESDGEARCIAEAGEMREWL